MAKATTLPRSIDELRGLRAARWIRESTKAQEDRYGPEAQREHQPRTIERHGLTDTGIAWTVAHSGRTVDQTPEWADMLARAGSEYDVLVVAYVSRFARNVEVQARTIRELHLAGAAVYFCDERLLSSDGQHWDFYTRESVEAESAIPADCPAACERAMRASGSGTACPVERHRLATTGNG